MIPEHGLVSDVVEYVLGKSFIARKSLPNLSIPIKFWDIIHFQI